MNECLINQAMNLIEKPVFYPIYTLYMHTKCVIHLIVCEYVHKNTPILKSDAA